MFCKLCHSEDIIIKRVVTSQFSNLKYNLYKCRSCCSCYFNENQHPVDYNEMYEILAQDKQEFSTSFSPHKTWMHQKSIIIKLLGHNPFSILDVGCRTGDFLLHFDKNSRRIGVEISNHFAQIAHQRGLDVMNSDLESISFTEQYEVVTCFAILEHLHDPLKFLNSLQSLVQPGGILVIMIPSIQTLKASLTRHKWHMLSPPEHLNFFSTQFLDKFITNRKFEMLRRYYSSGGMLLYKGNNSSIIKTEALFNQMIDASFVNKWPIFDHMYSYYLKK